MLRRFRPNVEALNDRVMLSAVPLNPGLDTTALLARADSDLRLTLEIEPGRHRAGENVLYSLTETNVGTEDALIREFCYDTSELTVTRNGVQVWRTPPRDPSQLPHCPMRTLRPGESRTIGGGWINPTGLTGNFELQVAFDGQVSNFASVHVEPGLAVRMTTHGKKFRLGQPITITLTQTNHSDRDFDVTESCFNPHYQIRTSGPHPELGYPRRIWMPFYEVIFCNVLPQVLKPGETRTFTFTWNGQPNRLSPGEELQPGRYTIEAGIDGIAITQDIVLKASKNARRGK